MLNSIPLAQAVLLMLANIILGACLRVVWKMSDKVDLIDRRLSAVIQKIGGIEV